MDQSPSSTEQTEQSLERLLEDARERVRASHLNKSGLAVARRFAEDITELLARHADALVQATTAWAPVRDSIALIATGGYGRCEMNLFSDVDILFLLEREPGPNEEDFIKAFLYPLWNLKLDLGYSVKTVTQLIEEVGEDIDLTTSLIGMHLIWGSEPIFVQGREKFRMRVSLHYDTSLTERLTQLVRGRHRKYSGTPQLLEPNLKEAPGGLRDIHTLAWLCYIHYGHTTLDELTSHGLIESREERQLRRAHSYLLTLRNALHLMEGRKCDLLNVERQIRMAPQMGHVTGANLLPEEHLMRTYYEHATLVDRLTRRAVRVFGGNARSDRTGRRQSLRAKRIEGFFRVRDNVVSVDTKASHSFRDPYWTMHLFTTAALYGFTIDDSSIDFVSSRLNEIDDAFRRSPVNRDRFLSILGNRRHAARVLRQMHTSGFLDTYVPEFGLVRNLPRIDYYHQFTVDEHLLRSVECVTELFDEQSPFSQTHAATVAREILRLDLLVFALLVHDVGKGEGRGHVIRGAHIIQRIAERMNLRRKEAQVLHDLVLHHQRMSRLALKRNPDDPQVPRELAKDIGDAELLRMLYVLTCCDLRAVANDSWNDWRGSLLSTLYEHTVDVILKRETARPSEPVSTEVMTRQVMAALNGDGGNPAGRQQEIEDLIADLPDRYRHSTPPHVAALHCHLADELNADTPIAWKLEPIEDGNYAFLHCVAHDSPGLFGHLCGALASRRFNILSAQIYTAINGVCIDVFQIQDAHKNQPSDHGVLDRMFEKLIRVIKGEAEPEWESQLPRFQPPISAARLEFRPPTVTIANDDSANGCTIIEVNAPDRPGLLYEITSVLDEFRINVQLALVATESYQVVDVFYVTDWEHNRLEPGPQTRALHKRLLEAIEPPPESVRSSSSRSSGENPMPADL